MLKPPTLRNVCASPAFWAALAVAALLIPTLNRFRLLGLDEGTFALIAKEAARDGHWIPLTWKGRPYFDKAPFMFWIYGWSLKAWPVEASLRIWSVLAGAGCAAYAWLWGRRLGGGAAAAGLAAVLLLVVQEHFILYSRVAQMDAPLGLCLLGAAWHALAWNRAGKKRDAAALVAWGILGALAKSWFFLAAPMALSLALVVTGGARPGMQRLLWLPFALTQAAWLAYAAALGGRAALGWLFGFDLGARLAAGGAFSGQWRQAAAFYGEIALRGSLWALPAAAAGLLLFPGFRQARRDAHHAFVFFLALLWTALLLFGVSWSINYFFPLTLVLALWGGAAVGWIRSRMRSRARLAAALALALYLGGGLAFGLRYTFRPPNPNKAMVEGLRAHPARYRGEPLLLVGSWANSELLRFYSDYEVVPVPAPPARRPAQALLLEDGRFLGPLE